MAAAGAAVAAIGVVGFGAAKSLGELGDSIEDTGIRMGLTTKEVGDFRFAMKYAGGDMGALEGTMRKLSQALSDGSSEGAGARERLREMGVQTRTSNGELRSMAQLLPDISEKLGAMKNSADRNAAAVKILGRSGLEVLPDLLQLSGGIQRAKQLGLSPSQEDIDRWGKYQHQIVEVEARWEALKRRLKEPIAATILFLIKGPSDEAATLDELRKRGYNVGNAPRAATEGELAIASRATGIGTAIIERNQSAAAQRLAQAADDASRLSAGAAAALDRSLNRTLEGAQQQLERLKSKYDEARNKALGLAEAGKLLPEVALAAHKEVDQTRLAYERQKDAVAQISKLESSRTANRERIRELLREGQTFLRIGTGLTEVIVSGREIAKANEIRKLPTLNPLGSSQMYDAAASEALQRRLDIALGGAGDQTFIRGAVVSPEASRVPLAGQQEQLKAFGEGLIARATEAEQRALDERLRGLQIVTSFEQQILELRSEPGKEIENAQKAAAIRQNAIAEEFRLTGDIVRFREDSLQNELDMRLRIAEVQRRQMDDIRSQTEGLLHTLITDRSNFGSQLTTTIRDAILKPIEQGIATRITSTLQPIIFGKEGTGGIRGALGGIFGAGTDPTKTAIDSNTAITSDNTAATRALTRAMSLSASGGGGSIPGGTGGILSQLSGLLGGPGGTSGFAGPVGGLLDQFGLPVSTANPLLFPQLPGGSAGAPNLFGIPGLKDRSVNLPFGIGPTTTLSAALTGGALAGGGTAELIAGIQRGGLAGGLGIGAGIASITGGILPLLNKGLAAAGPWGAAIGGALQLVSMFIDMDPKKKRAEQITKELESAQKTWMESSTYTVDTMGRGIDYNYQGQMRSTVVNNWNVQAMDAASFKDFATRNGEVFGDVTADQLDSHGPLQQKVRSTALPV